MDIARYAELFRTEAREHLAGIDDALVLLADGGGTEAVDALFRATHTIKGMAGAMGYASVEQMAHAIETLLAAVRDTEAPADATLLTLLYEATDALAQHVDDAVDAQSERPVSIALLERLASVADSLDGGRATRTTASWRVPIEDVVATAQYDEISDGQTVHSLTDEFGGDISVAITSSHSDAELEAAVRSAGDVARVAIRAPQARTAVRDVLRNVRIDLKRLDALLDLVGEIVITRDRLLRVADASGDRQVMIAAQETSRLVSALQDEILQARMVPVGQVFDRFPRLVRDVARDLGKQITFTMEGRDITLDRSMLDAIGDPIVHLLRNAIDHGLEQAEARAACGKPASGRVILRAVRDRAAIVIEVEDDGRGIDRDRVLARAIAQGRLERHITALSDDDLVKLLAQPGFSMSDKVTSVSGRGVGIDVVASRVRALGGALDIQTSFGRGTRFSLRLPVTLAIVRALLVQVGARIYAVPTAHVLEAADLDGVQRLTLHGRDAVSLRDDVMPLVRLRHVFGVDAGDDAGAQLVVLDAGGKRVACQVDALIGQQDIVVKPFDTVRGAAPLFSGATILGDGSPALIVDVGSLA